MTTIEAEKFLRVHVSFLVAEAGDTHPLLREAVLMGADALRRAAEIREHTLRAAQQAVIDRCSACNGRGTIVGTITVAGHGCDGTEEDCARTCPVGVPEQTEELCEYCGRPVAAIQELLSENPLLLPAVLAGAEALRRQPILEAACRAALAWRGDLGESPIGIYGPARQQVLMAMGLKDEP